MAIREKKVIMGLTPNTDFVGEIFSSFRMRNPGVDTEYVQEAGGSGFMEFLSGLEQQIPKYDIMLLNDQQMEVLKERGLIDRYVSPESEAFPERARDPDGYATQVFLKPFSIAYNTEKVKSSDVPQRYEDILDPKWKGRLIYPDPRISGSGFGWYAAMKEYLGKSFFIHLSKQDLRCLPTPELSLLEGDYAILVAGMVDRIEKMKEMGHPVDWIPMPIMWFAGPFAVLFRRAKHPNLGKSLISFLLSGEGQQILSRYYIPNRPEIQPAEGAFVRVMEKLAVTRPVPFNPSLGKEYQQNQEEAFRLLLGTNS